jgi:DNA-binding PadR family transcriptional regulator
MAQARKVGNPLALAVLSYLTQRPMHPYELSRTLRQNDDGRSIKFNHGSLYMVFGQLAKAGFVVAQETARDGQRPERTLYALTPAGRAEMHAWLRSLVEEPEHEYPHFVAALSLIAALPPDEVVDLLGRRRVRLQVRQDEIATLIATTLAAGEHPLFLVEEEYRLALLNAEAAFVDHFIERIIDPNTGWAPAWAQVLATFPLPARTDPSDEDRSASKPPVVRPKRTDSKGI